MFLARLPEAIICGLISPGEDAEPIFFSLYPLPIVTLPRRPPQRTLFAGQGSSFLFSLVFLLPMMQLLSCPKCLLVVLSSVTDM